MRRRPASSPLTHASPVNGAADYTLMRRNQSPRVRFHRLELKGSRIDSGPLCRVVKGTDIRIGTGYRCQSPMFHNSLSHALMRTPISVLRCAETTPRLTSGIS